MMPLLPPNKQVLNQQDITKLLTTNDDKQNNLDKIANNTPKRLTTTDTAQTQIKQETSQNNSISIPNGIRQSLTEITQSFSTQQTLTQLLSQFNKQQRTIGQTSTTAPQTNTTSNALVSHLFDAAIKLNPINDPLLLAEQLQTAIQYYNSTLNNPNANKATWQEKLMSLLIAAKNSDEPINDELIELGNKWLSRSNHNGFMQQLQINSGNAILLQDIPIFANHQWHGAHLEIEENSTNNDDNLPSWNILIQFTLDDEVTITAKAILNAHQEIKVFIWSDDLETTTLLNQHKNKLNKSLSDLGLITQPILIANGKPSMGKDEEKPHALAGSVNLST